MEGSRPRLAVETQALLRSRLRAAATLLAFSFGLFFIRAFFLADGDKDRIVVTFLGLVLFVLVACRALLSSGWPLTLRRLRVIELVIFGLVAVFFVTLQYRYMLLRASQDNPTLALATVKSCVLFMFALMSTYGIFIPNTWRRAALVVAPMALGPSMATLILHLLHPELVNFSMRVVSFEQVSENGLMLLIGAGASVYGTHVINTLRSEVFEARQLGQYRLRERIGAGGMGEVFLAEHRLLKRPCALKLIRPGSASDPRAMARFEREVRTTARLSHPNTVEIYDYGRTEDGTFYYVMEYLPGLSLAELVERHGPLPAERVIYLLRQACQALQEAHAAGLIHRDIKPANIFAAIRGGRHDVTKLLDFGLVKPVAETPDLLDPSLPGRGITGSPLYMAPEQASGSRSLDPRSDLYSLGAVAYFLLTGRAVPGRERHRRDDRARPRPRHSPFAGPAGHTRGPGAHRAPPPGQGPRRSLPGRREPGRGPRLLRIRPQVDLEAGRRVVAIEGLCPNARRGPRADLDLRAPHALDACASAG